MDWKSELAFCKKHPPSVTRSPVDQSYPLWEQLLKITKPHPLCPAVKDCTLSLHFYFNSKYNISIFYNNHTIASCYNLSICIESLVIGRYPLLKQETYTEWKKNNINFSNKLRRTMSIICESKEESEYNDINFASDFQ